MIKLVKVTKFFLRMIAAKTSEESQIKFGMVKERMGGWGGGAVFSFYLPSQKNDATALISVCTFKKADEPKNDNDTAESVMRKTLSYYKLL